MGTPGTKRHFIIDRGISKEREISMFPFRSDLKECIEKVEKNTNEKVIGIVFDETFTIELLTQKK
jgi:hypothetical protein